jgi:methyl-accepting chemotaxis protein
MLKDNTDSNTLGVITQCEDLVEALERQAAGDFSVRVPEKGLKGEKLRMAKAFNRISNQNQQLLAHMTKVTIPRLLSE